jgi:thiosulfate/3-mercaptopyruvate sulfurtransferase
LIGRNPLPSYQRPYAYVPVRHVPAAPTSFEFYGQDLLANFDSLPTWAYATPHNIQRQTPQTASCNACHGQAALFLTADKVRPEEMEANRSVIVESVPEAVEEP